MRASSASIRPGRAGPSRDTRRPTHSWCHPRPGSTGPGRLAPGFRIPTRTQHDTRLAAFDDAGIATTAVDAAVETAASAPAPDDPVISVLFTLAVVALSVLTLGVAYLSISSFLDQRQEEEDRKKAGFGPSKTDAQRQGAPRSTTFDESAFQPAAGPSKKKRKPKKKSEKGFGN